MLSKAEVAFKPAASTKPPELPKPVAKLPSLKAPVLPGPVDVTATAADYAGAEWPPKPTAAAVPLPRPGPLHWPFPDLRVYPKKAFKFCNFIRKLLGAS